MSAATKPSARLWIAGAATGAVIAGGLGFVIGPGAPLLIDHFVDGQRVWRLGHIEVDDVRGAWLGDITLGSVQIADSEGVWLEAEDVALNWSPQDLLFGAFRLETAQAARINVLRRPALLERRPRSGGGIDVDLGAVTVDTLSLAEPVVGEAAAFSVELSLALDEQALQRIKARLTRVGSEADRLFLNYNAAALAETELDLFGAPGGVLARLLGVSDRAVIASAQGAGSAQTGSLDASASIGEVSVLDGEASWTPTRWSTSATAEIQAIPALQTLARRLGPSLALSASGERSGAFEAHAETPFLAVDVAGELDEERNLVGPAQLIASSNDLSAIARESPFEHGAARLEGALRQDNDTYSLNATLTSETEALGERVTLRGSVQAELTPARFTLETDLRAPAEAPPRLRNARLQADLAYDRERRRFALERASLVSDALRASARGWSIGRDGEFSGEWEVRSLSAFSDGLRGEIGGRWRAFRDDIDGARVWAATFEGRGAGVSGEPAIATQLLGPTPRIDARLHTQDRGINVTYARIDGQQGRAGVSGRIAQGQAALDLELSARGPLSIGGADILGAVDATGTITGRLARPTLDAQATLSSFVVGDVRIDQPVLDVRLAPQGQAYVGRTAVRGAFAGQPVDVAADARIASGALQLTNIDGHLGGVEARGEVTFSGEGARGDLALQGDLDGLAPGLSGRVSSRVSFAPDTLRIDAALANARAGELFIRTANISADGSPQDLAARFDLRGSLRQARLAFEGTASLAPREGATIIAVEGRGALAGAEIFTRAPLQITLDGAARTAALNFAIGDGVVIADWRERGRALSGSAQLTNAPLAPLAAIFGERAEGRINGEAAIESQGSGLSGAADLRLVDARFAGRQSGRLNLDISADLDPTRLQAVLTATSTDGLQARFEAQAPVVTSADPIRIALAPERSGRATWSVSGPAESLWAAARLPDQSLQGEIDGEGELSFGAGSLSGDGHIEIAQGRFEDKLTGVTLENLNARLALDERGVTIERFTAQDGHGGRLVATGGSASAREGAISVQVENMRIADRPDARARASGELALTWEGLHSTLSGELNIIEAELDIAANPEAGIPTIDVIEINAPDSDLPPASTQTGRNGSTELDVRIRAPGRVFTRGRGVDAEWALDMRLGGTARAPRVFGEARAIRGTLSLSGAPFVFEEARIVFTGDPLDAQIELRAARETADLTAYINLSGTARDPEVTFTSDPGLPEDEILPQVLFGRSVEDLSAFEAAQLAASLATLSGRASLDLVGAARAAAGLDRFNVRQDEDGGLLVAGGVYLTRDVYVELARTGLGQAETRVEWTVRPRLVLITSFLAGGEQNVSVRWRRESD